MHVALRAIAIILVTINVTINMALIWILRRDYFGGQFSMSILTQSVLLNLPTMILSGVLFLVRRVKFCVWGTLGTQTFIVLLSGALLRSYFIDPHVFLIDVGSLSITCIFLAIGFGSMMTLAYFISLERQQSHQ